ncbi:uncharacterized protein EI97DRAFT_33950 [Westerdykella ornata]|uniref:Uncharacterized protein n=1 Tax=Westerdykella ornata TaxID=318751 RepID=A0A6A6K0E4_WESOR|nr:uncharacterized protein EI97DRAFT_33950 [Westerdykella ornata]KAF2281588.1 hypothetical protein EI97DRAFT_33950 [Westerdykella ornata]
MSSTPVTAATAPPAIPLFTPAPYCFDDIWAVVEPCEVGSSATCTFFSLGRNDGDEAEANDCMTDATFGTRHLPGTACPISYTSVNSTTTAWKSRTRGTLACCPSHQSFTYTTTDRSSDGGCAAVSPSLPGTPPWTVTVSQNSLSSPATTASAVFDPAKDLLMAPALSMTYVVEDGVTGDGRHPLATATPSARGCDTMCDLGRQVTIIIIVVPIVSVALIVGCVCWCCISTRRRRREIAQKRQSNVQTLAGGVREPPTQ